MNRAQRVQEVLRLEALASAAADRAKEHRAALDAEARAELEQHGAAPSWRLPDVGTVALPLSKEAPVIADVAALLPWVEQRYPGEVETIRQVRAAFQTALLGRVVCSGDLVVDPETGEVIPGMAVRPGGQPKSLTITASRDVKAAWKVAGRQLLDELLPTGEQAPDGSR